jgi:integrase
MASLQARHSRSCKTGKSWTTFEAATKAKGCSCKPMYHVAFWRNEKLIREVVGHDRQDASRALRVIDGNLATRRYRVLREIRFAEWGDEWIASRRRANMKESSVRGYEVTIAYAKEVFGSSKVRDLEPRDVSRLLEHIRSEHLRRQLKKKPEDRRPISNASLAKHVRQLGACLNDAVKEQYAAENPVRMMSERPRVEKADPSYFTDAELNRLWAELTERPTAERPVYSYLCRIALATGMRSGELLALRWGDVSFTNRRVEVARTFVAGGVGETTPKSGKARRVYLTPEAAGSFEGWFALSGDEGLVFEKETGGHLDSNHLLKRVLYPAMERAGVDRVGEHGRERTFHSFRHSFARIMLEAGAPIVWVQQALGHSNPARAPIQ